MPGHQTRPRLPWPVDHATLDTDQGPGAPSVRCGARAIPPRDLARRRARLPHRRRLGLEDSPTCFDFPHAELHVTQQLRYSNEAHGGFFLKEPKGGSAGTIEFDEDVQQVVTKHLATFGSTNVDLVDATTSSVRRRKARLLFTDAHGRPFHDRRWCEHWTRWRNAAGWPVKHGTFHALRHFCATTMLTNGVDPQHVQKTLRHASLQFTLTTYVHWLPRNGRPTSVVSRVLRAANDARTNMQEAAHSKADPCRFPAR